MTGLGRGRVVRFLLEGPGIRHRPLMVVTRPPAERRYFADVEWAAFEFVAEPARAIRGVVRDRDTGKPVAGVKVSAQGCPSSVLTDVEGRYELPGCSAIGQYVLHAEPRAGSGYFAASREVQAERGTGPVRADLDLIAGIPLRGRVTDEITGKPPRMAVVHYHPLFPNPHADRLTYRLKAACSAPVGADGSYSLAVLPGAGAVCVTASPRGAYAAAAVEDADLARVAPGARPPGERQTLETASAAGRADGCCVGLYNAVSLIRPQAGESALTLDLTLRPGRCVKGIVVGPDGEPLTGVRAAGLAGRYDEEPLDGAAFLVTSLDPQRGRVLTFRRPGRQQRRTLTIRGDEVGPLVVRFDR
jgi:hypothetical protein